MNQSNIGIDRWFSLFTGIFIFFVVSFVSANPNSDFPRTHLINKYNQLIDGYCIDCHNFDDWKGKLEFESLSLDYLPDDAEIWESVIRKLRGGLMPPPGEKRPTEKINHQFTHWLEDFIDYKKIDSAKPHNQLANHSNIQAIKTRRLNRKEYRNAVRDLLHIDIDVESLLPQDIAVDGFDNMAHALSVSPIYLDQSLYAARFIATQVIGNVNARPVSAQYVAKDRGNQQHSIEGMPLGTRGGMSIKHYFPVDGDYQLNIGNLARAMWVENQEFTHRLVAFVDGQQIFELDIGGGDDLLAIDTQGGSAVDKINARLKNIPFYSHVGFHELSVTFVHRSFAESEGFLQPLKAGGQPNVIRLRSVDIHGPINAETISSTSARQLVFSCYPQQQEQQLPCATEIIQRLAIMLTGVLTTKKTYNIY